MLSHAEVYEFELIFWSHDAEVGFPTHIPNSTSAQTTEAVPAMPTVVHLSIRPYPPPGVKDTPKKKGLRHSGSMVDEREDAGSQGCCSGCVIC